MIEFFEVLNLEPNYSIVGFTNRLIYALFLGHEPEPIFFEFVARLFPGDIWGCTS